LLFLWSLLFEKARDLCGQLKWDRAYFSAVQRARLSFHAREEIPRKSRPSLCLRGSRCGGQVWIRTTEGVSQRIYSPPRLATSLPAQKEVFLQPPTYTLASDSANFSRPKSGQPAFPRGSTLIDLMTMRSWG